MKKNYSFALKLTQEEIAQRAQQLAKSIDEKNQLIDEKNK